MNAVQYEFHASVLIILTITGTDCNQIKCAVSKEDK